MPAAVLQRGADGGEGGLLVLGIDVRLLGETRGGRHHHLDGGEEVEGLAVRPERDHDLLGLDRGDEHLTLAHDHLGAALVQAGHEGGHVDLLADRRHAHDAVAEVGLRAHDQVVVREDLLVLRHPAADGLVGLAVAREVPGEVDAPVVVRDVRLDRLVHHTAEAGGEIHPVAGVRSVQELDRVVVRLGPDGRLEHRAGGLERPLGLALRFDDQAVEGAEHLEPVGAVVLVDHGHDLVARLADPADEVGGHGLVAVVHREVHERDLLPGGPLRHVDLFDGERLRELQADVPTADEAEEGGRGADAVDGTDGEDLGDDAEHGCLHEVGPGCHPTFRIDGTISLLGFPLASLVWKAF